MAQTTTENRAYTLWLSEDLPTETFLLSPGVEHDAELDAIAMTYMAAKLAFFKAVSPTRSFPDRWVNYDGATIVAEETREHVRLFPTSP